MDWRVCKGRQYGIIKGTTWQSKEDDNARMKAEHFTETRLFDRGSRLNDR